MVNIAKITLVLGFSSFFVTGSGINPVWAASPVQEIKVTVNRVLEIINDPKLKGENNRNARRDKLRETIFPRFDFSEMAKRALGKHWGRNPEKQREFVAAFSQLLEDSYAEQIEAANAAKVAFTNERIDGEFAEVSTKVTSPKGEETPIVYKLHRVGSEWKVYDVIIANISLVNNYRSQFNRVLTNASLDELIKRIKEKTG